MSETHSEVNWAQELGLHVPQLWMEHPGHPTQLRNKKLMLRRSEVYWKSRHLESLWASDEQE